MHQALLVGLPASGKTTFLAAFWHVIFRKDVDGALELEVLGGSVEHLNDLTGRWLRFEVANRTSSNAQEFATIRVRPSGGGSIIEIVVPDLAGESIRQSLVDRRWPADFQEFVRGSTGVLLFVHPEKIREPWQILDAIEIANEEALPSPEAGEDADAATESEWSADQVPTEVELVDLLQLLCTQIAAEHFRLAVIVSAWDLVEEQGVPSEWLAKELPLVDQFLSSSHSRFDFRVYGVSAQGGEIPRDSKRLESLLTASERICVVLDANAPSRDITAPLRWAVDVDTG